jgi:hypothetical protein
LGNMSSMGNSKLSQKSTIRSFIKHTSDQRSYTISNTTADP